METISKPNHKKYTKTKGKNEEIAKKNQMAEA